MLHSCIRVGCGKTYDDSDPDPYYCPSCNEERKKLAAQLDTRYSTVSQPVVSELQAFEAQAQTITVAGGRKVTFGRG